MQYYNNKLHAFGRRTEALDPLSLNSAEGNLEERYEPKE